MKKKIIVILLSLIAIFTYVMLDSDHMKFNEQALKSGYQSVEQDVTKKVENSSTEKSAGGQVSTSGEKDSSNDVKKPDSTEGKATKEVAPEKSLNEEKGSNNTETKESVPIKESNTSSTKLEDGNTATPSVAKESKPLESKEKTPIKEGTEVSKSTNTNTEKANTEKIQDKNEKIAYLSITGVDDKVAILSKDSFEIEEGDTVFTLLQRATKDRKIQMEFTGKGATCYVEGIDNLYEFDKGEGSGWMVCVNGIYINKSSDVWPIKEGDYIEWKYTKDLGKDIGGSF
ncbi:MAG: DUF4430 domain-containing protein [Filifactoraceae bacterium]